MIKTDNYIKKRIVNAIFNEKWYNKIKLFKIILDYKFYIPYEISPLLKDMLTKDSIVLDIGANMGQYACRINNILKNGDGEVYSFEPVNTNFMALRSMKRKLKLTKVTIIILE